MKKAEQDEDVMELTSNWDFAGPAGPWINGLMDQGLPYGPTHGSISGPSQEAGGVHLLNSIRLWGDFRGVCQLLSSGWRGA